MARRNIGLILAVVSTLLALAIIAISSLAVITDEPKITAQGALMMRLSGIFGLTMILISSLLIPLEPVSLRLGKGTVEGMRRQLRRVALGVTAPRAEALLGSNPKLPPFYLPDQYFDFKKY
jgi:hypothetical protein